MKKLILSALALCSIFNLYAQNEIPKSFVFTGLSLAKSKDVTALSMPVALSHSIAGNPHFRYIVGVRQSLAYGAAEFTFNKQDTWIDDLSNYSINLMGGLEYISDFKFLAGFNIDLIGATVGTRSFKTIEKDPVYKVSPETVNILLGGSNDKGSLNSEFYIGYRVSPALTVKAGFSHYHLGLVYTNSNTTSTSTGTFLNMPFIHLQYTLWER
jgi:hypothetical protein